MKQSESIETESAKSEQFLRQNASTMVHLLFLLFPFNVLSFKMFQLQHGAIAIDIADYFYSFQLFQFDANGCSMWLFVCVQPQPRI